MRHAVRHRIRHGRSLYGWWRRLPLLFLVEWDFLVDCPQPAFALLGNFLKSIILFEVMPNTTLPAMSVHTVLVIGILLANLVVNLLELKTFRRSFGQNFVQSRVIGMIRLLELLFGALLFGLHR